MPVLNCDNEQRRVWQLFAFLNTEPTAIDVAPVAQTMDAEDRKVLLRANSNYFVLHALYSINVARKIPHSRCATKLLQSASPISFGPEYKLNPPLYFT